MVSALLLSPFIWVAIGALIAPIYGLIPIYAVGAAFLNVSVRKKAFSFATVVFLQIGFWDVVHRFQVAGAFQLS